MICLVHLTYVFMQGVLLLGLCNSNIPNEFCMSLTSQLLGVIQCQDLSFLVLWRDNSNLSCIIVWPALYLNAQQPEHYKYIAYLFNV